MKKEEIRLDRREFTVAAALLALSGVSITISACGGGGSSPAAPTPTPTPAPTPTPSADKVGQISANHGHSAVIVAAKLASPVDIALDIKGTASHTHTVVLSAAEVTLIAGNTKVTKTSTTDGGHSHDVTFN